MDKLEQASEGIIQTKITFANNQSEVHYKCEKDYINTRIALFFIEFIVILDALIDSEFLRLTHELHFL